MANLKLYRGVKSSIPSAKEDGALYVASDTHEMFLDVSSSTRIQISNIEVVADMTALEAILVPVSTMFYYVTSKNQFYKYISSEWKCLGSTLTGLVIGTSASATTDGAVTNGTVYMNLLMDGAVVSSHSITGAGVATVSTDASGNITIRATGGGSSSAALVISNSATGIINSATTNTTTYLNLVVDGEVAQSHKITGSGKVTVASDANGELTLTGNGITSAIVVCDSASGTSDGTASNGDVHLNLLEDGAVADSHAIVGSGKVSVTSDSNGDITIDGAATAVNEFVAASDRGKADAASTNGNTYLNLVVDDTVVASHKITGAGKTSVTSDANGVITITGSGTTSNIKTGATAAATANAAATNGNVYLNLIVDGSVIDSHKIVGTGNTTVVCDANGVITINSTSVAPVASSLIVGASATATANAQATNGNVHMNLLEDGSVANAHKITGSGKVSVTSDASGDITVSGAATSGGLVVSNSASGKTNAAATAGNVYLNHLNDGSVAGSHKITGSGKASVTSDANGVITVNAAATSGGMVVSNSASGKTNAQASNGNVYLNHLVDGAVAGSHKIQGSGGAYVTSDANGVITVGSSVNGGGIVYNATEPSVGSGTTWSVGDTWINITPSTS